MQLSTGVSIINEYQAAILEIVLNQEVEEELFMKARQRLIMIAIVSVVVVLIPASAAWAVTQFRAEFIKRYVKRESNDSKDKAFAELVDQAGCNICHLSDDRTKRNPYGQALDKLLDRKTDARNKEKIQKALETVEKQKANPDDPKSQTFGERIKAGQLPYPVPPELMDK